MNIDEIRFEPRVMWHSMLSYDEWSLCASGALTMGSLTRDYIQKIMLYYERFGEHMPIAIRKDLLRDLMV